MPSAAGGVDFPMKPAIAMIVNKGVEDGIF
jgi:hypothetical protein